MKLWNVLLGSSLAVAFGVASASAGPGCDPAKKSSASGDHTQVAKSGCGGKSAATASHKGCSASDQFPAMVRMVGDEVVACPMAAEKMKSSGAKVVFAVAGQRFDTETAAEHALAEESEKYVSRFLSIGCLVDGQVKYCDEQGKDGATASAQKSGCASKSGTAQVKSGCSKGGAEKAKSGTCSKSGKPVKFVVAGQQFDTWDAAVKARDDAQAAVKKVAMKYIVNGKEVDCASKVCPIAKKAGQVEYVIGDHKIKCEDKARAELARAQYEVAKGLNSKSVASL